MEIPPLSVRLISLAHLSVAQEEEMHLSMLRDQIKLEIVQLGHKRAPMQPLQRTQFATAQMNIKRNAQSL